MTKGSNKSAQELWNQLFAKAAADRNATLYDPEYDLDNSEEVLAKALGEAGWSEDQIIALTNAAASVEATSHGTSPGVGPGLEERLAEIAKRVASAMSILGYSSQEKVVLGIDPKAGVSASLTNVVMTDEGIVSVSSFLFRWCGLIARAYLRTLLLDVHHWSDSSPNVSKDKTILLGRPDLIIYWCRIFFSFSSTGTHILTSFRPSMPHELVLFEQIAWAMEFYVVAHEYAHHALDHRSSLVDQHDQEFEADALAIKICERLEFEPFRNVHNPYASTGASAVLMLRALAILSKIESSVDSNAAVSTTHPLTSKRVSRITNRNALQPNRFEMDRNFNDTVIRIMDTVEAVTFEFIERGGADLLKRLKARILS